MKDLPKVITFKIPCEEPLEGFPIHLRCENFKNPLGIDIPRPRLSWWVGDTAPGARQLAYQIIVMTDAAREVWDSGKVISGQSVHVEYAGPRLLPAVRYEWRVRTWSVDDVISPWSQTGFWEMGLLDSRAWEGKWIGHPPRDTLKSAPAIYLRRSFHLSRAATRGRLYVTAKGIYEVHVNGRRVGDDYFTPGWTDYRKRNQYLTYDVTGLLQEGENVIGAIVGDGWHNGYLLSRRYDKNWYGGDTSLLAQLVVETGRETVVIATDNQWRVVTGPIVESDIYHGETHDARLELGLWDSPGYDDTNWLVAGERPADAALLQAKINPPVRRQEELPAITRHQTSDGEWIFDFGQNLAGWARLRLKGRRDQAATLRFAEMLNPDGTLYVENLRRAGATDRYIFGADEAITWEPLFTYHGFRYAGLTFPGPEPSPDCVRAIVLHADIDVTGAFETSDGPLNRLQQNILWSQKANCYDIFTDCPQRDERLGWTGDAQMFLRTATFNMDVASLFEKWLADIRDAQQPDGQVTYYAPALDEPCSSAGYSDAGVICPWIIFERYGNRRVLEENYAAMTAWADYLERTSVGLIRPAEGFGDHLSPDAAVLRYTPTPKDLIGTAYFAHVADLVARSAAELGRSEDQRKYERLNREVVSAFQRHFVTPAGRIVGATQTAYALALEFNLLTEDQRRIAGKWLAEDIRHRDWHLSTGFPGTSVLMRALRRMGRNDIAYRLLFQDSYPGWLYMVKQGATTMWERWNSYIEGRGFGEVRMNSFNHHVLGLVGEWMYAVILGIDVLQPGFREIAIEPVPWPGLDWARGHLDSPYGRISSEWRVDGEDFHLTVMVPPNASAIVRLPDGSQSRAGSGQHMFQVQIRQS